MVLFLTLAWKHEEEGSDYLFGNLFLDFFSDFIRALGWEHEDGYMGTGDDGSQE